MTDEDDSAPNKNIKHGYEVSTETLLKRLESLAADVAMWSQLADSKKRQLRNAADVLIALTIAFERRDYEGLAAMGESARIYRGSDPQPSEDTRKEITTDEKGAPRKSFMADRSEKLPELRNRLERWMRLDLDVEVESTVVEYSSDAEPIQKTVRTLPESPREMGVHLVAELVPCVPEPVEVTQELMERIVGCVAKRHRQKKAQACIVDVLRLIGMPEKMIKSARNSF